MMEWLQLLLPAWIMGTLLVFLTAPLGCLMLWRRMSFFADTMAHGTLLGVAIAGAMALPLWMGVAFIAGLLVAILWVLHDPRLPNDALLALCSATLLCSGLMFIQHIPSLRPELLSYLFGDLLTITWADLPVFATVIVVALAVLYKSWQAQIQIAIDPDMAVSEGVSAKWQRLIFMLLLALFTILALRAVGSLLMGALLVIPALTARLIGANRYCGGWGRGTLCHNALGILGREVVWCGLFIVFGLFTMDGTHPID
jgi:zinc transport system permease protein